MAVDEAKDGDESVEVDRTVTYNAESLIQKSKQADPEESEFSDLKEGDLVGRFVLQRTLGEGGMGIVFVARDPELQREVAVKVLRPAGEGTDSTAAHARMLREAQAMAMLSHPNLVTIYEVGTFDDHVFLAMEYVIGRTLDAWLNEGQHLEDVIEVFGQAAKALQAIHDAGLVHRDFKPANVMVTERGIAKVLDLGIARKIQDQQAARLKEAAQSTEGPPSAEGKDDAPQGATSKLGSDDTVVASESTLQSSPASPPLPGAHSQGLDAFEGELTVQGALVGTPSYMAPEQLLAADVSPKTDQFAFAIALFEALTKRRPFAGKNHVQVMANIVANARRPWPEGSEVPLGLREAIDRALLPEPKDRYESMTTFLEACRTGLGLRGQIRYLTKRWTGHDREPEYLLPNGALLSEGLHLVRNQPDALNAEQTELILESARRSRKRRLQRRLLVGGIAALGVGMIPTLSLLQRKGAQLEEAKRAEVLAHMSAIEEGIAPLMERAEMHLQMMFAQRDAWLSDLDQLMIAGAYETPERPARMLDKLDKLNRYFRPVIELTPMISSLMVAREDEFEALFFQDPDAGTLKPPYDFYNRVVWNAEFGDDAFEAFWDPRVDGRPSDPRGRFLPKGSPNTRGVAWEGYVPSKRVWYEKAVASEVGRSCWTDPYLFFVTKDAGVTGSIHFTRQGKRYVLAVDFMLTDLSRVTAELESDQFLAAIVTREGRLVGLPRDGRFDTPDKVRRFFSDFNRKLSAQSKVDAGARLPTPKEAKLPLLAAAMGEGQVSEGTYQFDYLDRQLWAGRAPVGPTELGLSVYVVELPVKRGG